MRKFILGMLLLSTSAFANNSPLLSNGLVPGSELELLSDIQFGVGAGVFYVVDTDNTWRKNSKPDHDQSYCTFFASSLSDEPKVAKAGEVYQVASISPFQVVGGVGTKIELLKLEGGNKAAHSPLTALICTHSHIETTKNTPRIRTVLRYELYVDEFTRLLAPYLKIR